MLPRAIFCLPILLTAAATGAETPSVAPVRRLTEQPGHALAFDERGALYFGKERTVYKLTPDGRTEVFATLEKDQGETPYLWSLRLGPDSFGGRGFDRTALYAARRNGIFEIPVAAEEAAPASVPAGGAR